MASPIRRNGAYAPLGANYYHDDAIIEAGERAEVLYCRALAFCAGQTSDGYITDAQVIRVAIGLGGLKARIKKLVDSGLWEKVDGGYLVRAWLKWNRSAEEIGREKAKDRERKTKPSERDDDEDSIRIPDGIGAESDPTDDGFQEDSEPSRVETRARHKALHVTTQQSTSVEVAPTDDPTGNLLIEHANAYATQPPPSALIPVRNAIAKLVAEKITPDRIRAGLTRMRDRQLGPGLLPQLVAETTPTNGARPSTTDQRVAAGRELAARYRAQENAE